MTLNLLDVRNKIIVLLLSFLFCVQLGFLEGKIGLASHMYIFCCYPMFMDEWKNFLPSTILDPTLSFFLGSEFFMLS